MNNDVEHLTGAEAARRLHIDRSTLSRWVAAGRISPVIKLPGIRGPFVFEVAEVERVKAKRSQAAS